MKPITITVVLALLLATTSAWPQTVVRGPYLQMPTDDGITIRWRTDVATDSVVRYGPAADNLVNTVTVAGSTTEHSVTLSGLGASQHVFYSVGDSIAPLAGDASYHFYTSPTPGNPADTRFWVIGDSGTANSNARAVRDAFKIWTSSDPADFWLMLGDNAYNDGTDVEYQAAVFDIYPELLRQLPLWSTLGNHDGHSADSGTQSGPYYDIFNLPTAAEVGGLASGTEAYYSFDYANIHFVCLDSYDSDRGVNGSMLQWLESDLALNTQPWVIAFFHHPPYTKGSHDSDTEGRLIDMRQNALPILEAWGVDLVMTGHSHTYERSYLIDGHYGSSATLDPVANVLDPGDGSEAGDGAYEKPDTIAADHAGAVYAVAGSSGKVSLGYPLNHPAMFVSLESLGSLVIDVSGNRMDVVFLDQSGAPQDEFTLLKTPDFDPPLITGAAAQDVNSVLIEFNEPVDALEASDASNYVIAGLSISQAELLSGDRSVRLTTSNMTHGSSYTVEVSNVQDTVGNTIVPGSSASFDFYETMTVSFQDGLLPSPAYAGTRDATIREASADTPLGLAGTLEVDGDEPSGSGTDMSMLLSWDVSSIPPDATVESAQLQLEVTNISSGVYNCQGLLAPWTESEVTWNRASTSTSWGTPGANSSADRDSAVLCSVNASALGPLVVNLNAAGVAWVQSWVNSAANNHGLVISHPTTSDGADFHSRESATAMAHPRLQVTYRLPVTQAFVDQFATADVPAAGSVSGGFSDTHSDDGTVQVITERESGGKKNNRYSYLDHRWKFSVAAGASVTVYANAWSGGSTDGDEFVFAWSTDNNNFTELFTVSTTASSNVQSAQIPASGTVYIRVTDTDQTSGNRNLDSVFIDQLFIRTDNATEVDPPAAPTGLQVSGVTSSSISLAWQHPSEGETGFDLQRSPNGSDGWVDIASPGGGSSSYDDGGLKSSSTYFYRVRATNSGGVSAWSNTASGTTAAGASINLGASGYKDKGKHVIDLSWSGAGGASVEILRNGSLITTTANDGAYTDATGNKGSASYAYRVCETGGSTCSDEVSVVF